MWEIYEDCPIVFESCLQQYQIHVKMSQQTNEDMFTVLERGDRKIDRIKEKVIMMVGLTRVGKSCTFNWILKRQMVGQGDEIEAVYKTITKDETAAELGNQFTSVTLIPNSAELDDEISLVDMAGYGDTRNYIGVMGVSYFLKSVFEKVKEVKFLIVFNQHAFFDVDGKAIIRTFQGFFNMFKTDLLTEDLKNKLFSSISLVVTRSRSPHLHTGYLRRVITKINNPQFTAPNKGIMTELVNHMLASNRLHAFQIAKPDENPGMCDMLSRLELLKWEFLKIKEIEKATGESIITIPFKVEFDGLSQQQKSLFTQSIQERIDTYTEFASILKVLLSSLKQNWLNAVREKAVDKIPDNFMDSVLCFKTVFKEIQTFLIKSDKYNSEELIEQGVRAEYPQLNLVQAIKNVLNIYVVADLIGDQQYTEKGTFQSNMQRYSALYMQLADRIGDFCGSAAEERLVLRLKFVIQRGFLEFSKFYSIDPSQISQVNQEMKDKCNTTIFSESNYIYIQNFIKFMSRQLMTRVFTTISAIEEYQDLFSEYKKTCEGLIFQMGPEERKEKNLEFNNHSINISFVKADIYMKQGDRVRSGGIFISLLKLLCDQGEMMSSQGSIMNSLQGAELQDQLNSLFLMKLKVVDKLVNILIALDAKRYPTAKDYAISLCKQFNQIDLACEVYELQLKDCLNDSTKRLIYKNYADYCKEWGRYSEAKVLLQKKLRLQRENFRDRTDTINEIYNLIEDLSRLLESEGRNVQQLNIRLPEKAEGLDELLNTIKNLLETNVSPALNASVGSTNKS